MRVVKTWRPRAGCLQVKGTGQWNRARARGNDLEDMPLDGLPMHLNALPLFPLLSLFDDSLLRFVAL